MGLGNIQSFLSMQQFGNAIETNLAFNVICEEFWLKIESPNMHTIHELRFARSQLED